MACIVNCVHIYRNVNIKKSMYDKTRTVSYHKVIKLGRPKPSSYLKDVLL